MNYSFIGFDGRYYDFESVPDEVFVNMNSYENYLICHKIRGSIYFIFFNGNNLNLSKTSSTVLYNAGGNPLYICSFNTVSWSFRELNEIEIHSSCPLVYASSRLIPYSEELLSGNASIVLPVIEPKVYTLKPIIEGQENMTKNVFNEVFDILPVLLVAFIGFIGIRKGINWLFSFLKNS